MIEKFERLNEYKHKKESHESIILSLVVFFLIIFAGVWYYQNYITEKPNYQKQNDIKQLEGQKDKLNEIINQTLQENAQLRLKKQQQSQAAKILPQ